MTEEIYGTSDSTRESIDFVEGRDGLLFEATRDTQDWHRWYVLTCRQWVASDDWNELALELNREEWVALRDLCDTVLERMGAERAAQRATA